MQILDKFLFTSYHSTFFCTNSLEKLNSLRDLNGRKLPVQKNLNIYCPFGIENNHFRAKHTKVSKDIACSMLSLSTLSRAFLSYNLRWVRGTPFASRELYFSKESSGEFALIKNDEWLRPLSMFFRFQDSLPRARVSFWNLVPGFEISLNTGTISQDSPKLLNPGTRFQNSEFRQFWNPVPEWRHTTPPGFKIRGAVERDLSGPLRSAPLKFLKT